MADYRSRDATAAAGFSLMELLVVIAILGLVAGVTAARLSGPSESTLLKTESRKLVTHLRATRSKALSESRIYSVEAVDEGRGYTILPGEETVELPEPITLTMSSGADQAAQLQEQLQEMLSISFYPDGSASGGTLTLVGTESERSITVNWMTGEVALEPES